MTDFITRRQQQLDAEREQDRQRELDWFLNEAQSQNLLSDQPEPKLPGWIIRLLSWFRS